MKHLPLHEEFKKRGAPFISFGEWEVPAYCTSIIDEHTTVRTKAGIFDISHMGIIIIEGKDAERFLQYLTANDITTLSNGKALYTAVCNETGGIVDDIFTYKSNLESYFLIVNATNIEKDFNWFNNHKSDFSVMIRNISHEKGILALQGPLSGDILKTAWNIDLTSIPFHSFVTKKVDNREIILSTTGYTGEWGCEIVVNRNDVCDLWHMLIDAGEPLGLKPIGFGARDTLRLEACCLLYGQDMNDTTTPWEVGIGWTVKLDGDDFIGKEALIKQKKDGIKKKLVGLKMHDRGIPRHGYHILDGSTVIGTVTSGGFGPTVGYNIGLGFIDTHYSDIGKNISIEVRNKQHKAHIVERPFYRRKRNEVYA